MKKCPQVRLKFFKKIFPDIQKVPRPQGGVAEVPQVANLCSIAIKKKITVTSVIRTDLHDDERRKPDTAHLLNDSTYMNLTIRQK